MTCDKNLPRLPATAATVLVVVAATLCCLLPGFKNDECANVSGLQSQRKGGPDEAAGGRVVSTYPGLHLGKLLASVATRFGFGHGESFVAAKLSPFSDY